MALDTKSPNMSDKGARVVIWCVPRAISSALAKCLSFTANTELWFEPYTYSQFARTEYRNNLNEELPIDYDGNEEEFQKAADFIANFAKSKIEPERLPFASVKRNLEEATSKNVFVKDMGRAMVNNDYYKFLPDGYKHTFLIRHPLRYISSYRRGMYTQLADLGLLPVGETYDLERHDPLYKHGTFMKELYDLWKYVRQNIDSNPIVIDADDLLTNPAGILSAYCTAVGLPYSESLLHWDASTKSLKSWKAAGDTVILDLVSFYGTAMRSTEFLPSSEFPDRNQLTSDVIRLSDREMKYDDELSEYKFKV